MRIKINLLLLVIFTITNPSQNKTITATLPEEDAIPITEDLMNEHGILNRVLLIYDEIIRRIDNQNEFSTTSLQNAITIIKTFIEDYHEKIEETYIFPLFEKHNRETKLIKTLRTQHQKGRAITTQLQKKLSSKDPLTQSQKKQIRNLLHQFIKMYRPHEAREDTVIFPQVRSLLSKKEFEKISEISDELEHKLFGQNGFNNIVHKVEQIEKELGIYQLDIFTPQINFNKQKE
ncbi:MAG: hemerythrin domain-containing protein [Candidatus Dependentiae bacterium]